MDPMREILEALRAKDEDKVRDILKRHPGVANVPTGGGIPLLQMAVYARASRVVDALLAAGVEPTVHEAAALGDTARVRALVAKDRDLLRATSPDGMTPLHLAAHFGQRDTAAALLNLGADPAALMANALANTPMHAAAAGGQHALVELLVRAGAPVDARDGAGNTPLIVAAANGLVESVRLLLAKGADPAARNAQGRPALDFAEERGEEEVAALLRAAMAPA
jgi:ankyrin repeat protein